ncbi:MAG: DNA internalization-related competence protein ComEC/Rec2 [Chitinivorax sp.]
MIPRLLAFVAGVALLQIQPQLQPPGTVLACMPLALLAAALPLRWRPAGHLLLALALGFGWANLRAGWRMADQLGTQWEGRDLDLQMVVADLPQPAERGVRLRAEVESVAPAGAQVPRHIQLSDYAAERLQQYRPGQRWQVTVRLKRPHATLNPHNFDAESWMLQQNIRATGYIRSARLLDTQVWQPACLLHRLRDQLRHSMQTTLGSRPYAGLVIALVVGDQQAIPQTQWTLFARTGLTHLVSISGLHISLVAGLLAAATFRLWRRSPSLPLRLPARKAALLAGGATALGYALLAGFSVPTQRTLYMLLIAGWALWSGRSLSVWLILCLALACVALLDPWAVLAPGFWLSFGAVAWLVWAGSNRLRPPHWLRHWLNLQWALTLGLAPALLLLFQQLPLVAPLANALAIPLIGSIATPLCLLGAAFPPALLPAHWLIEQTMQPIGWLASWPPLLWQQPEPPPWALLLALPACIWLTLPRGWPARWLALPALLPLLWPPQSPLASGSYRLTMLDIGQGTAVVIRTAHRSLLYDTGPAFSSEADSGNRSILPYLRGEGVAQLDGLVLSHDDTDHTGGAASVLGGMPTGWLLHSLPGRSPLLARPGTRPLACLAGQRWQWDGVSFTTLAPTAASLSRADLKDNDRSCVIRVSAACGTALLTADIERGSEQQLLAGQAALLPADVLLVPHHGSKTSSGEDFVAAVAPRYALVSAGYRNRYGHPRADVLQRYYQQHSEILRTDRDGAVEMSCTDQGWELQRWRTQQRRYWQID